MDAKTIILKIAGRTNNSLMRNLRKEANAYSRATSDEVKAKKEKTLAREHLLTTMHELGQDEVELKKLRVLVFEKGGIQSYQLAFDMFDKETLEAITKYEVNVELAKSVLDAETLASISVPVVDKTKAKKVLDPGDIKLITIDTITTLNVNPKRQEGEKI